MQVEIKKELVEEKSSLMKFLNKFTGKSNTWYSGRVKLLLTEEELKAYCEMIKSPEHRGLDQNVFVVLPLALDGSFDRKYTLDQIINTKDGWPFLAKDNIALAAVEIKINEAGKKFKELVYNYIEIRRLNSYDFSGTETVDI